MIKIRHHWEKLTGTGKLKHAKCTNCPLQKWWDAGFRRLIYMDKRGNVHYRTPSCINNI